MQESKANELTDETDTNRRSLRRVIAEVALLVCVFFIYAGDFAPMVNEAHYLVKAKNFWQPDWCQNDLFASSGKAHTTFYALLGWPTRFMSFSATAWLGRLVGWTLLAIGLQRLCSRLLKAPFASLGVAVVWIAGVEHGNLAGEWVVGGIEAKVPAYGFVLMALAEMLDRRWERVWPLMGVASAFHVLSGGWSVIAAALVWWSTERHRDDRKRFFSVPLFVGGAIALLGLVPALYLTMGADRADATEAAHIYSYFRIKHHLLPADFRPHWFLRHGLLIFGTFLSWRFTRNFGDSAAWRSIGWFTIGAMMIAVGGLIVGMLPSYAPDVAAKLLRYYWFRLTDAIVPLMFGLLVLRMITDELSGERLRYWGIAVVAAATLCVGVSSIQKSRLGVPPSVSNRLLGWEPEASVADNRQVYADWIAVCQWAKAATPEDEIFLTPRHQQTFKWYAYRAEVVNWKDVPQDAASLMRWQDRFNDVFPSRLGTIRTTIQYKHLKRYRKEYGTRFMIVDRRIVGDRLPLVQIYPIEPETNQTYAVYELPTAAE